MEKLQVVVVGREVGGGSSPIEGHWTETWHLSVFFGSPPSIDIKKLILVQSQLSHHYFALPTTSQNSAKLGSSPFGFYLAITACAQPAHSSQCRSYYRVDCFSRLDKSLDEGDKKKVLEIKELIEERKREFREMEDTLPHENGYEVLS